MEYQFSKALDLAPYAECSMDHEAFGHWLTEDIGNNIALINQIQHHLASVQTQQSNTWQLSSGQFHLHLTHEDAIIKAAHLFNHGDHNTIENQRYSVVAESDDRGLLFGDHQLDDELSIDNQQGEACCGLDDFATLINEWYDFVSQS